jgi:hypothetical protein
MTLCGENLLKYAAKHFATLCVQNLIDFKLQTFIYDRTYNY